MIVSLLAALDLDRGIGIENRLPWRLAADQRRFRELTMGHHLVVGRKTFESIGRALPGRKTIIVTRNDDYRSSLGSDENCTVVHSLEAALDLARARGETEVFVGGGSEIYNQAFAYAERMYLTFVEAKAGADAFFPEWKEEEWIEQESIRIAADDKNQYPSTFKILVRTTKDTK